MQNQQMFDALQGYALGVHVGVHLLAVSRLHKTWLPQGCNLTAFLSHCFVHKTSCLKKETKMVYMTIYKVQVL